MVAATRRTSARRALAIALLAAIVAATAAAVAAQAPDFTISDSWAQKGVAYESFTAKLGHDIPSFQVPFRVRHVGCQYNGPFTLVGWTSGNLPNTHRMRMAIMSATFGEKGSFALRDALPNGATLDFDGVVTAPGYNPDRPIFDFRAATITGNTSVTISNAMVSYPVNSELPVVALSNVGTQSFTGIGDFSSLTVIGAKTRYGSSLVEVSAESAHSSPPAAVWGGSAVSIVDARPCGLGKAVLSFTGIGAQINSKSMVSIVDVDTSRCPGEQRVPEGVIYSGTGALFVRGGSSLLVQGVTMRAGPGGAATSAVAMPDAASTAGNAVTGGSSATFVGVDLGGGAFCPRCAAGAPLLRPDASASVYAGAWSQVAGVAPSSMDDAAYVGAGVASAVTAVSAAGRDSANVCTVMACQPGTTMGTEAPGCSCKCEAAGKAYLQPSCTAFASIAAPAPCTDPNCDRCGAAVDVCTACFPGYDLTASGTCVKQCSVPNCLACAAGNPHQCAVCDPGYVLQPNGTCQACNVPDCLECAVGDPDQCAVCDAPLVLEAGKCVTASSSGSPTAPPTTAPPTTKPPTTANPTPKPTSAPRCRVYYCAQCVAGRDDQCAVCKTGYGLTTIRTCVALRPNVHGAAGAASRAVAVAAVAAAALAVAL